MMEITERYRNTERDRKQKKERLRNIKERWFALA